MRKLGCRTFFIKRQDTKRCRFVHWDLPRCWVLPGSEAASFSCTFRVTECPESQESVISHREFAVGGFNVSLFFFPESREDIYCSSFILFLCLLVVRSLCFPAKLQDVTVIVVALHPWDATIGITSSKAFSGRNLLVCFLPDWFGLLFNQLMHCKGLWEQDRFWCFCCC